MASEVITEGVVVSLTYVLTVDGSEIARTDDDETMEYLHGRNNIVPGLEKALEGKKVGDRVHVTLPPEEAYGDYDEEEVEEIAREDLPEADQLEEGMVIEVEDEEGFVYLAYVKEIRPDSVVLDYNPPLAGKTLTYDVEVRAMRAADDEELEHGHPHSLMEDEDEE